MPLTLTQEVAIIDQMQACLRGMHKSTDAKTWVKAAMKLRELMREPMKTPVALVGILESGYNGNGIGVHRFPEEWRTIRDKMHEGAQEALSEMMPTKSPSGTERRILAMCRRKTLKGITIFRQLGDLESYEYVRKLLAKLVREGRLRKPQGGGYRTV